MAEILSEELAKDNIKVPFFGVPRIVAARFRKKEKILG